MLQLYLSLFVCFHVAQSGSPSKSDSTYISSPIQSQPHVSSIEYNGVYVGGGSIINRYFVLSALEVVDVPHPGLLTVRTGSDFSNKYGSVHNVCNVVVHPSASLVNVAVLQLLEPLVFDKTRQPIRFFGEEGGLKPGTKVVVSSWPKIYASDSGILRIDETKVGKNCSQQVFPKGVFCVDKPRGSWELATGMGHPVDVDGLQAGVIIRTYASLIYVIELAPFTGWIRQTVEELFVEKCSIKFRMKNNKDKTFYFL